MSAKEDSPFEIALNENIQSPSEQLENKNDLSGTEFVRKENLTDFQVYKSPQFTYEVQQTIDIEKLISETDISDIENSVFFANNFELIKIVENMLSATNSRLARRRQGSASGKAFKK